MKLGSRIKQRWADDDGGILVLSAFLLVVLFALAAFAVDITAQSQDRQQLWNSSAAEAVGRYNALCCHHAGPPGRPAFARLSPLDRCCPHRVEVILPICVSRSC